MTTSFFLSLLCLTFASCKLSPDPLPEEDKIVRADTWTSDALEVPRCGPRIRVEDILIIDLEALDYDAELLTAAVGPFTQVTENPIAVSGSGSRETIEQRAKDVAAGKGCDIVLMGPLETREEIWGGTGMTAGSGGSKKDVPYQLFRMGYRTD